jgi:hypothetical protein
MSHEQGHTSSESGTSSSLVTDTPTPTTKIFMVTDMGKVSNILQKIGNWRLIAYIASLYHNKMKLNNSYFRQLQHEQQG